MRNETTGTVDHDYLRLTIRQVMDDHFPSIDETTKLEVEDLFVKRVLDLLFYGHIPPTDNGNLPSWLKRTT